MWVLNKFKRYVRLSGGGTLLKKTSAQLSSLYRLRDLGVHTDGRTNGQTDMTRSTRVVILVKDIYTL